MNANEPYEIDELLRTHGFDALSASEKDFVLRHLADRKEYELLRAIVLESSEPDVQSAPAALKDGLMAAFDEKHAKKNTAIFPLFRKRPFLLAAASISLLIAIWWAYPFEKSGQPLIAERKVAPAKSNEDSMVVQTITPVTPSESIELDDKETVKSPEPTPDYKPSEAAEETPNLMDDHREDDEHSENRFSESMDESTAETKFAAAADSQLMHEEMGAEMEKSTERNDLNAVAIESTSNLSAVKKEKSRSMAPAAMNDNTSAVSLSLSLNQNWLEGHYTAY